MLKTTVEQESRNRAGPTISANTSFDQLYHGFAYYFGARILFLLTCYYIKKYLPKSLTCLLLSIAEGNFN